MGSRVKLGAWLVAEDRDRAFDGRSKVDNPMNERTQITVPLLTVDVRITDQFGVQGAVSVPDVTRSALVPRPAGPAVNFSETFSGLGDTSVLGWYRLRPIDKWFVVTTFGGSLPTGKTETPRFKTDLVEGSLVPTSRLQRGSGTVDPLLGASLTRKFGVGTVFTSLAARVPLYQNKEGLRTGASSELNTGFAREIFTTRISTFARLGWLHRAQDQFQGTPVLVGGGNWIHLSPGIAAQVGKGINVQAEVKLPIYRSLANKQLDSAAIFQFGVSRSF